MQVFNHHIYEFQKGLRNLVLCTENNVDRDKIEKRLKREKIFYLIQEIDENKINVYFGHELCIEVVKTFGSVKLNELSDEQDFILGIMLGYSRLQQCERYLKRISKNQPINELIG
jgi:hypothetical protein